MYNPTVCSIHVNMHAVIPGMTICQFSFYLFVFMGLYGEATSKRVGDMESGNTPELYDIYNYDYMYARLASGLGSIFM